MTPLMGRIGKTMPRSWRIFRKVKVSGALCGLAFHNIPGGREKALKKDWMSSVLSLLRSIFCMHRSECAVMPSSG
jgi:hypothetical protein